MDLIRAGRMREHHVPDAAAMEVLTAWSFSYRASVPTKPLFKLIRRRNRVAQSDRYVVVLIYKFDQRTTFAANKVQNITRRPVQPFHVVL